MRVRSKCWRRPMNCYWGPLALRRAYREVFCLSMFKNTLFLVACKTVSEWNYLHTDWRNTAFFDIFGIFDTFKHLIFLENQREPMFSSGSTTERKGIILPRKLQRFFRWISVLDFVLTRIQDRVEGPLILDFGPNKETGVAFLKKFSTQMWQREESERRRSAKRGRMKKGTNNKTMGINCESECGYWIMGYWIWLPWLGLWLLLPLSLMVLLKAVISANGTPAFLPIWILHSRIIGFSSYEPQLSHFLTFANRQCSCNL